MQWEDKMNINFSRLEGIAHLDNKILLDSNTMKEMFGIRSMVSSLSKLSLLIVNNNQN